ARRASPSVDSRWRGHFFCLFSEITVTQSRKKQLLTLANFDLPRQEFFFLLLSFFCLQKNGIAHFAQGLRSLCSRTSGFALRRLPLEMPFFLPFFSVKIKFS
ncbi:MAG: hypothetical protein IJC27_10575, partial [Lentisphaeria bacterium]|nr:hypothetical protein [Lentisphaeria bacterium]